MNCHSRNLQQGPSMACCQCTEVPVGEVSGVSAATGRRRHPRWSGGSGRPARAAQTAARASGNKLHVCRPCVSVEPVEIPRDGLVGVTGRRRMRGATRAPGPLPSSDQWWVCPAPLRKLFLSFPIVDMFYLTTLQAGRACPALPTTTCTPGWCGVHSRAGSPPRSAQALGASGTQVWRNRRAAKPPMAATAAAAAGGTSVARPRSADVLGVVILDAGKRSAAADDMLLSVASVYG